LIYLQLALFFCYFTFLKLSNTSKIFFFTPYGVYRGE